MVLILLWWSKEWEIGFSQAWDGTNGFPAKCRPRNKRVVQYCRPESSRILLLSIGKPEVSWCKVLPSVWMHWTRIDSDGKAHFLESGREYWTCVRNKRRNFILMTHHYLDLGSASDFTRGTTNQNHYPDLGSDASSAWNFCACFSDIISRGNRWWLRKMSSVFSG